MKKACFISLVFFVFSAAAEFIKNPESTKYTAEDSLLKRSKDYWINLSDDWYVHFIRYDSATNYPSQNYLSLGGQRFYVYSRRHHDCHYANRDCHYANEELKVEFLDINGDGWKDLLISGIVYYTGTVDFEIYEQEAVVFIYLCDPAEQRFVLKHKQASFDIEVENDAYVQWQERYNSIFCTKYRELDDRKRQGVIETQHPWHYVTSLLITKARMKDAFDSVRKSAEDGSLEPTNRIFGQVDLSETRLDRLRRGLREKETGSEAEKGVVR